MGKLLALYDLCRIFLQTKHSSLLFKSVNKEKQSFISSGPLDVTFVFTHVVQMFGLVLRLFINLIAERPIISFIHGKPARLGARFWAEWSEGVTTRFHDP